MSKIYTKTGDKGETGLIGGQRVKKDNPRIIAYGEIDELNAFLGTARSLNDNGEVDTILNKIQNDLFDIGASLATPTSSPAVDMNGISQLEQAIDRFDRELPPIRNFILPGGSPISSVLHQARTICRRGERSVVALAEKEPVSKEILIYLNRLSDLLFVLARWFNFKGGVVEPVWERKK